MKSTRVHISATEGHTLCGLRVDTLRGSQQPYDDWLITYRLHPDQACSACRRAASRSADRFKAFRAADQARTQNQGTTDLETQNE